MMRTDSFIHRFVHPTFSLILNICFYSHSSHKTNLCFCYFSYGAVYTCLTAHTFQQNVLLCVYLHYITLHYMHRLAIARFTVSFMQLM
uniref:Uncharacterized protein n=1 Tax=Anguilla anguilla TaxID=7936 RepID=A0A0E9WR10_ANGAN